LELDRRTRRDNQSPIALAVDLRERLAGYQSQFANCDATNAQTLADILDELEQIITLKPSGSAWRSARERLLKKVEALPVQATPAQAFDD
jgi:hypothetical protein